MIKSLLAYFWYNPGVWPATSIMSYKAIFKVEALQSWDEVDNDFFEDEQEDLSRRLELLYRL